MPSNRETVVLVTGPRNDVGFNLTYHEGETATPLFRLRVWGSEEHLDLSAADYVQMSSKDDAGYDLPTVQASKTHPLADWGNGLVAMPIAAGNVTNHRATVRATLIYSLSSVRQVASGGILEILETVGYQGGILEYPSKSTAGTTGTRFSLCFTNQLVVPVPHNLNGYPSIVIKDPAGEVIIADTDYIDENNIVVTFKLPTTGCIYLN